MKHVFRLTVIGWILLGLLVVIGVIQFVPVDRLNPPVEAKVSAPANVQVILQRTCYDCHSNETVWPWYSQVAPFSWLVARDVRKGREELNFSTWNRITTQEQAKKLKESWEKVAEGEMPPWFYLSVHRDATLSAEDRLALRHWALSMTPEPEEKREK